ncbi:MAG: N-acetylmuramoyl-L-alanine amidase [Bradyrhizobiaceae bacterium]|nr:N-acetylmuramoyl-L-alanine amidase [Bradyrhizobiaceae bacterium]
MKRGIFLFAGGLLLCAAAGAFSVPLAAQPGVRTAKPAIAVCNRAAFRTILDVGHTAQAPGATSARGVPEYDFNLWLARRIEARLREAGFDKTVLLVTGGEARKALAERVARANVLGADLFVSIHHDSVPDFLLASWDFLGAEGRYSDHYRGHSIFVSAGHPQYARSLAFARLLGRAMKARGREYTRHYTEPRMGARRRALVDAEAGVYRFDRLFVLTLTKMPAVLFEAGPIIHREEELAMQSPERQALIADAVTEAVEGFCASRGRARLPRS